MKLITISGEKEKEVSIPILEDNTPEKEEQFTVRLEEPKNDDPTVPIQIGPKEESIVVISENPSSPGFF